MSREIKFRAWSIKKRKYIEIDTLYCANGKVCGIVSNGVVYDADDVILEQDTGLKDENGKRICEGDIIQCHLSPVSSTIFTGVVEFRPGCIMFKNFADGGAYAFNFLGAIEAVIGNIHENPELLEH